MAFIELKDVTKKFHAGEEEYSAVRGVSLGIESGEFVAVMGPSGSGKSTLLSLVGGLSHATSGIVSVDGIDLGTLGPNKLSDFRREYLGFVFQSFYLVPYLTALENVMLPLTVQPGMNGTAGDCRAGSPPEGGPCREVPPVPVPAFGRRAGARCHRPGDRQQAAGDPRR